MTARPVEPSRLLRLIDLYRRGFSARSRRRILRMGSNTERNYAKLLASADLLTGNVGNLPTLDEVSDAVRASREPRNPPQQTSRAEPYRIRIEALAASGMGMADVYVALAREHVDFAVPYSSVARMFRTFVRAQRNTLEAPDEPLLGTNLRSGTRRAEL